ncbi:hypothetical protein Peur_068559 [Populus x canadensis]
MEKQMESPIPLHNEIPQLGLAIFLFPSSSILIKRRRGGAGGGWEGGDFKSEENDQKSENFHENDSREKVGDGLDKKNERSNGNVNNDKRLSHQYHVRPEAKDRASYMNIGTYKFGANCKFNHPIRRKNQAQLLLLLLELLFRFVFSRHSLINPVDLLVCLRTIKNNAFQASEYPVVITLKLKYNSQAMEPIDYAAVSPLKPSYRSSLRMKVAQFMA